MRWIGTLVAIPVCIILVSGKLHGIWLIILVCVEVLFVLVEIALLLALKIGESPLRFLPALVRAQRARPPRPYVLKASYLPPSDEGNLQSPFQEVQGLPYDELQRYEQGTSNRIFNRERPLLHLLKRLSVRRGPDNTGKNIAENEQRAEKLFCSPISCPGGPLALLRHSQGGKSDSCMRFSSSGQKMRNRFAFSRITSLPSPCVFTQLFERRDKSHRHWLVPISVLLDAPRPHVHLLSVSQGKDYTCP